MNHKKQLSAEDIQNYRSIIADTHGYYDPKKHAHILATYIHQHLDRILEDFSLASLSEFKHNLIMNTLAKGSLEINADDLYLELDRSGHKTSLNTPARWQWLILFLIILVFSLGILLVPHHQGSHETPDFHIEPLKIEWFQPKSNTPFPYTSFDIWALRDYILIQRNGLVASPEHFYTIIFLARENDIDPILLFSIIGQEQSFVPINHPYANEIIHNPFNVFHSWQTFNTTLAHSTQIAINTIHNRFSRAPTDVDLFVWLNETYAEDLNWHEGVRFFYHHMNQLARPSYDQ